MWIYSDVDLLCGGCVLFLCHVLKLSRADLAVEIAQSGCRTACCKHKFVQSVTFFSIFVGRALAKKTGIVNSWNGICGVLQLRKYVSSSTHPNVILAYEILCIWGVLKCMYVYLSGFKNIWQTNTSVYVCMYTYDLFGVVFNWTHCVSCLWQLVLNR